MRAEPVVHDEIGFFRVFAKAPGGTRRDITMLRGSPITVESWKTADPFTDVTLNLAFPQITVFDRPGQGDLDWFVPYANIDVVWENTGSYSYDWKWEGFIVSPNFTLTDSGTSYSVECKGALYLLDNYLAEPRFPSRPIPYELLIKMAFDAHPLRMGKFSVEFPAGWDTVVPEFDSPDFYKFLKPWGVKEGDKWTGLTSRTTGSWDYLLTGYIQGLLSVMYDTGGSQWTIRKDKGRKPVLHLRRIPASTNPNIVVIDLLNPGITLTGSRDFTQSANIIFGEGSDIAGVNYSGMQISANGLRTSYVPFASQSSVFPETKNPNFNPNIIPKQTHIKFPTGIDEDQARHIASAQLQRFADPGITGSITLTTDVTLMDGTPFPAKLIKGGRTCQLKGLFGTNVLVHITEAMVDETKTSVTLTYDSKYRDQLTVAEVRARTRDALTPLRALQVGKYSNTVQDLLLPWSYREGSGMLPRGSRDFWDTMPDGLLFPYETWTQRHPPKDPKSQKYYVKASQANRNNATLNWAGEVIDIPYQSPTNMYQELFDSDRPNDDAIDRTINIRWENNEPTAGSLNDVWMDTVTRKKFKFEGNKYALFHNATFETLMEIVSTGLNNTITKMYYMTSNPSSPNNDDIWIERPSGDVHIRRSGAWVLTQRTDKPTPAKKSIPIRMSQSGSIRLSQICAYDKDGNVKPVRFHVSLYSNSGVTSSAMPQLYKLESDELPEYLHPPGGDSYESGQRMPFFRGAFENIKPNGEAIDTDKPLPAGADIVIGWGNYFEPAGYSPGRQSRGATRTGMLVDETNWSYDLNNVTINPNDRNDQPKDAGLLYVEIYCDDDDEEPTFFLGRFFRQEPGAS